VGGLKSNKQNGMVKQHFKIIFVCTKISSCDKTALVTDPVAMPIFTVQLLPTLTLRLHLVEVDVLLQGAQLMLEM
jgi:hypothetical protein